MNSLPTTKFYHPHSSTHAVSSCKIGRKLCRYVCYNVVIHKEKILKLPSTERAFGLKSQCRKISRISNHFQKFEFWLVPPKQPFRWTISRNDIKKFPSALHFEKFGKVRKLNKNTFFIREIAANFNNFQGSSTSAWKLLLTWYCTCIYQLLKALRLHKKVPQTTFVIKFWAFIACTLMVCCFGGCRDARLCSSPSQHDLKTSK